MRNAPFEALHGSLLEEVSSEALVLETRKAHFFVRVTQSYTCDTFLSCLEAIRSKLEDLSIYDCIEIQMTRPKLDDSAAWTAPHCSMLLHFNKAGV